MLIKGKSTGNTVEQQICLSCGMCCDGTLFMFARLNRGEKKNLPEKIKDTSQVLKDEEYFTMPCKYFTTKCTIYHLNKPNICSTYRCNLLPGVTTGEISPEKAVKIIKNAKTMRQTLLNECLRITGTVPVSFRTLLSDSDLLRKAVTEDGKSEREFDILMAQCNIFETLLVKYFRSTSDFQKMIAE